MNEIGNTELTETTIIKTVNTIFKEQGLHNLKFNNSFNIDKRNNHVYTFDVVSPLEDEVIGIKCNIFQPEFSIIYKNSGEKRINIHFISKCGEYSGTRILNTIIEIGKELGVNYIKLEDDASVSMQHCGATNNNQGLSNFSFSIANLDLLATGMSWYNKFGFKEADDPHENNVKIREEIRNTLAIDIDELNTEEWEPILDQLSKELKIPKNNITLKDMALYYKIQISYINNEPNAFVCATYKKFINFINDIPYAEFPYINENLVLTLVPFNQIGGIRRLRKRKSKYNTRRLHKSKKRVHKKSKYTLSR